MLQCHYQREEIRDKIRHLTSHKTLLLYGSDVSRVAVNGYLSWTYMFFFFSKCNMVLDTVYKCTMIDGLIVRCTFECVPVGASVF